MKFDFRTEYQKYRAYTRQLITEGVKRPMTLASVTLVATLFFIAVLTWFALKPTLLTISQLWRETQDEKKVVLALDQKIEALKTAAQNLQRIEPKLDSAQNAIPKAPEVEEFAKELELLASKDQLNSISFNQAGYLLKGQEASAAAKVKSGIVTLPLTVTVGGGEKAIRAFITDLESLERLTIIKTTLLSAIAPENRQQQPYPLSATLNLDIFYQKN